jgi:hypothetical protein
LAHLPRQVRNRTRAAALNLRHRIELSMEELQDDVQEVEERKGRHGIWALAVGAILLGLVVALILIPSVLVNAALWTPFGSFKWGRTTRIDTSAPSVVEKIRQLSRLESVQYSIDKIVEGNRQAPGIPDFLAGDRLLFIAHGDVIAGVDLAQLGKNDVRVDGEAVQVRLPAAQILTARIDNEKSRVYQRNTGLLVPVDPNLESQVRQAAEQQITQAALDDKILDKARDNARVSVTGLLYALGFRKVDVQ